VVPVAPPAQRDRRIALSPIAGLKRFKGLPAGIGVLGPVDGSERRHDSLSILPGDELQGMPDQVNNTGLNNRLGEHGGDRLGEAFQAVDHGDQDVAEATVLQFVHDAQPEFCALRLLDPDAQDLLGAVGQDAECDVDGLVANETLVPDLDPDGIEEDQRIKRVERPVLPFADRLQDGIGDGRDQVRRDVDAIEFLQVSTDLAATR